MDKLNLAFTSQPGAEDSAKTELDEDKEEQYEE
jgi:hypothetical protein